tara:strand:+ start:246 stop:518 length:273 start_codon:yes stop_codon:yes gene_type:complete
MDWLTMTLGLSSGGAVLWVLKKIPNEKICAVTEGCFEKLGILMTAGLTKFWATKKIWNSTIEPYFIDLVDNVVGGALRGLIKGLRSDNKK